MKEETEYLLIACRKIGGIQDSGSGISIINQILPAHREAECIEAIIVDEMQHLVCYIIARTHWRLNLSQVAAPLEFINITLS